MQRLQQEADCEKIALFHLADFGAEMVCSWTIEPNENLDAEIIRIADAIRTASNDNLEAYEGDQRYQVRALDSRGEPLATHSFKLHGGEEASMVHRGGSGDLFNPGDEPPTDKGLMAQLMRHVERKESSINNMLGIVVDGLISENRSLRANQEKADDRRIEYFEKLETLSGLQHERDEDAADRDAHRVMKGKALEHAITYFPVLASHLLKGKSVGPVAQAVATAERAGEESRNPREPIINGYTVAQCQGWLREIVKAVGGIGRVKGDYDDEHVDTIDNLLGVGDDPESLEAFRELFRTFIDALPQSMHADLAEKLSQEQKENLSRIVGVL
jgi:hypothetical protein